MSWSQGGFWLLLGLLLVGWGEPLSRDAIRSVDWDVDYAEAQSNPQRYLGKTLLLGGRIVGYQAEAEGGRLDVLCYRVDKSDKPEEVDSACGSFVVRSTVPLDAQRFRSGRLVTLTGTLVGTSNGEDGKQRLEFRAGELYLWPTYEEEWPPYRYDPFCDPWYSYGRYPHWYPDRCW